MIFSALRHLLAGEAELERQPAGLERLQAGVGIDVHLEDLLGVRGGDLLDVHAALGAGHQHRHADGRGRAPCRRRTRLRCRRLPDDEHLADLLALLAGLLGDQRVLEHHLGDGAASSSLLGMNLTPPKSFPCRARVAVALEPALAAAAGVDLGLEDDRPPPSCVERLAAPPAASRRRRPRERGPGGGEQFLGLVFVDLIVGSHPGNFRLMIGANAPPPQAGGTVRSVIDGPYQAQAESLEGGREPETIT